MQQSLEVFQIFIFLLSYYESARARTFIVN